MDKNVNKDKDKVIIAIAFAATYPTLESYLKAKLGDVSFFIEHTRKPFVYFENVHTDFWQYQTNIAKVALANGYKGLSQ